MKWIIQLFPEEAVGAHHGIQNDFARSCLYKFTLTLNFDCAHIPENSFFTTAPHCLSEPTFAEKFFLDLVCRMYTESK